MVLNGHVGEIKAFCFSSDGHTLALFSDDSVRLWDPTTGDSRQVLKPTAGSSFSFPERGYVLHRPCFAFSPDSRLFAFATGSHSYFEPPVNYILKAEGRFWDRYTEPAIELWDFTSTVSSRKILEHHSGRVDAVCFSSDGSKIASAFYSGKNVVLRVWDTGTGQLQAKIKNEDIQARAVALSLDNSLLIAATLNDAFNIWNWDNGTLEEQRRCPRCIKQLALSECGNYLTTEWGVMELRPSGSRWEVYVDGEWIVRGQERVLWLPPDMRAHRAVVVNDLLIISDSSGDVKLVQF